MSSNAAGYAGSKPIRSAVSPEVWAPVMDALLHGVVHTANNRIAALGGILQLQEMELATPQEGIQSLRDEFAKLRILMERFRDLGSKRGDKKAPASMSDAIKAAALLLAQHSAARQWKLNISETAPDVEQVLLWPSDPLRFAALLILATGGPNIGSELSITTLQLDGMVEVTLVSQLTLEEATSRAEYQGLAAAVASEGGSLTALPVNANANVMVTLALPGLSKSAS